MCNNQLQGYINIYFQHHCLTKIQFLEFLSAKVVVELAKSAYIDAAVMLHPSFVTLDDIHGILPLLYYIQDNFLISIC